MGEMIAAIDAAREFGLDESTIRKAIQHGLIPGERLGYTWMVKREDVQARYGGEKVRRSKRKPVTAE